MLPTSEYDLNDTCTGCESIVTHRFDTSEEKRICGWYGEPDFSCTRRLPTPLFIDLTTATDELTDRMALKYVQGAIEHGGYGWEMGATRVLGNAADEVADLGIYLKWARDAIATIRAIAEHADPAIREAILRVIDGDPRRR